MNNEIYLSDVDEYVTPSFDPDRVQAESRRMVYDIARDCWACTLLTYMFLEKEFGE